MAEYANVSGMMAGIVSSGMASLHELETVYGYEDALDMLEIMTVRNYNAWAARHAAGR